MPRRPLSGAPQPAPKPCWRRRWLMIRAILIFCAALGFYLAVWGQDDRLRETALLGVLTLGGSVALGYLGFATQDDRNWLSLRGGAPERGADAGASGEGRR